MTWNTVTIVWLLLSAAGTVIITVGIAVWVLRHYNQDIKERESVSQRELDHTPNNHAPHNHAPHNHAPHNHDPKDDIRPNSSHHDHPNSPR
jgi:ABC-type nickel/cobalt efflux system permease component RcnA